MRLKTRFITLTALGLLVLVAFSGVLPAAHAQSSANVDISLSDTSVEQGTAITVTMTFSALEADSDTSTTDYIFRADVLDSYNGDADDCEGSGLGSGQDMAVVDEDPEVRTGTNLRRLFSGSLYAAGQHLLCRQHRVGLGQRGLHHHRPVFRKLRSGRGGMCRRFP